jgi:large subunit ribosomal protein L6
MSRLGKLPITIPSGTDVRVQDGVIIVKGPKGELRQKLHPLVTVSVADGVATVSVADPENKKNRALWGLFRVLIQNMVSGVNELFEKKLEINGVGYKASASGSELTLNVGYSHPVKFPLPAGITVAVDKNIITVSGIDKQVVGEIAANIRKIRKPEPYKGKGIKYVDEILRRKAGKTAASA